MRFVDTSGQPAVAPRPQDFPKLLDTLGTFMRKDYDYSTDVAKLKMPVLRVYGDSDRQGRPAGLFTRFVAAAFPEQLPRHQCAFGGFRVALPQGPPIPGGDGAA